MAGCWQVRIVQHLGQFNPKLLLVGLTVVNEDTEQLCVVSGHPLCPEGGEGLDKQVIRDTNWVVGTVQ